MGLPKQVRQQIAEAKRIEGELRAGQAGEQPPTPAPDPQPTPASPTPTPAAPAAAPQPTPVTAPTPVPPAPAPARAPDGTEHYAELLQQYRSLQGIHRTLVRSNSELQSSAQTLRTQVDQLTSELAQLKKAPAPQAPNTSLSAEEIKEFGPDLISVIERKAQEVAAPLTAQLSQARQHIDKLQERNAQLEQSLGGINTRQAQDAQARFSELLGRLVPDFNTLNYDRQFLSWLSQVDPLDAQRRTLQQRMNEAVEALDAEAVAGYFDAFRKLVAAAPAPTPNIHAAPRPDLVAQAQPTSRAAPDVSSQAAGKIWSPVEISTFYADVARGKYTAKDKARIEGEIYKAQRENRIAA